MKDFIKKIPIINTIARKLYYTLIVPYIPFERSADYWKQRYKSGGNSGAGSYTRLSEFKAEILNAFVKAKEIEFVIEYGCGDGHQLGLAQYPNYIGFDVSPDAILLCEKLFASDNTKSFKLVDDYSGETASLTMSLDVIYHLLEDKVFFDYMERLFNSSSRYVVIYSSNMNKPLNYHVRHRKFSTWIDSNMSQWKLIEKIPNKYPYFDKNDSGDETSFADFYIYEKR